MVMKIAIASLLLAGAAGGAPVPKAGNYAFNWLKPDDTCKALTAKDAAKLTKCEASDNAFGLQSKSLMCKVDAKTELVVYETAAQCQEGLETMQANGD